MESCRIRDAAAAPVSLLVAALLVCAGCEVGGPDAAPPGTDAGAAAEAPQDAAERPRSVVLITIDTLRADALGAYGRRPSPSPRIDRLAAAAVRFEQCSAASPSTLPSHATILTGTYPYEHGARNNGRFALSRASVTLAEHLRDAGFATGAEVASTVLGRRTRIDQGFDHFRDPESPDAVATGREYASIERPAADVTRRGLEFVREHRGRPFFLWLHYFDVHAPYAPPAPFASVFRDSPYHGEVAEVDQQVGRFARELEELGLAKDTLVIVTADHGEGLGEHGEETHLFWVYETTIRVPLILWGPEDLATGRVVATPVRTADIAPTVTDWLGVAPMPEAVGASLLPLARGLADETDRLAYGESLGFQTLFGTSVLRFVREGSWKYVHKVRPELFDLASDPGELHDRAADEPERVAHLRDRLRELLDAAPPAPSDSRVAIDETTARQLEELGYLAATAAAASEGEIFAVAGVDPADLADDARRFRDAAAALSAGHPERSLAMFRALARDHPRSPGVLEGVVNALIVLEREDEVVAALPRLVELDPTHAPYQRRLIELYEKRGDPAAARRALDAFLERWPCDEALRERWAGACEAGGPPPRP